MKAREQIPCLLFLNRLRLAHDRRPALLGPATAGEHALRWEAGTLPSGLYLVRLTAGATVQTQRLTLVR